MFNTGGLPNNNNAHPSVLNLQPRILQPQLQLPRQLNPYTQSVRIPQKLLTAKRTHRPDLHLRTAPMMPILASVQQQGPALNNPDANPRSAAQNEVLIKWYQDKLHTLAPLYTVYGPSPNDTAVTSQVLRIRTYADV